MCYCCPAGGCASDAGSWGDTAFNHLRLPDSAPNGSLTSRANSQQQQQQQTPDLEVAGLEFTHSMESGLTGGGGSAAAPFPGPVVGADRSAHSSSAMQGGAALTAAMLAGARPAFPQGGAEAYTAVAGLEGAAAAGAGGSVGPSSQHSLQSAQRPSLPPVLEGLDEAVQGAARGGARAPDGRGYSGALETEHGATPAVAGEGPHAVAAASQRPSPTASAASDVLAAGLVAASGSRVGAGGAVGVGGPELGNMLQQPSTYSAALASGQPVGASGTSELLTAQLPPAFSDDVLPPFTSSSGNALLLGAHTGSSYSTPESAQLLPAAPAPLKFRQGQLRKGVKDGAVDLLMLIMPPPTPGSSLATVSSLQDGGGGGSGGAGAGGGTGGLSRGNTNLGDDSWAHGRDPLLRNTSVGEMQVPASQPGGINVQRLRSRPSQQQQQQPGPPMQLLVTVGRSALMFSSAVDGFYSDASAEGSRGKITAAAQHASTGVLWTGHADGSIRAHIPSTAEPPVALRVAAEAAVGDPAAAAAALAAASLAGGAAGAGGPAGAALAANGGLSWGDASSVAAGGQNTGGSDFSGVGCGSALAGLPSTPASHAITALCVAEDGAVWVGDAGGRVMVVSYDAATHSVHLDWPPCVLAPQCKF